jgi:Xaa-Pro aminopeptidase
MTEEERDWLDAYHAEVYEKIAPLVSEETKTWLYEVTKKLPR